VAPKKPSRSGKTEGDSQYFSLRMPTDLHRQLKFFALSRDSTLNDLIIEVLAEWWGKNPEKAKFSKL
jgi:predicted HicB family RNase H-like nuclease